MKIPGNKAARDCDVDEPGNPAGNVTLE